MRKGLEGQAAKPGVQSRASESDGLRPKPGSHIPVCSETPESSKLQRRFLNLRRENPSKSFMNAMKPTQQSMDISNLQ